MSCTWRGLFCDATGVPATDDLLQMKADMARWEPAVETAPLGNLTGAAKSACAD